MNRSAAIVAAALLAWLGSGVGRAAAQVPAPPPESEPVLELVAPVASPVCGDAVLAVTLTPVVLGGALGMPAPDLLPVFGPAFVVCGSIPAPPQRLRCMPDDTAQGALDQATGTAIGSPLPLDTGVTGALTEEIVVLEDTLGPPADTAGLSATAVGTLQCKAIETPVPAEPEPETPPPDTSEAPQNESTVEAVNELALPDLTGVQSDYGALDETPPVEAQLGLAASPTESVAAVGGPGFAYPVVFAIPLALLAIVGYFGWVLTRPVSTSELLENEARLR